MGKIKHFSQQAVFKHSGVSVSMSRRGIDVSNDLSKATIAVHQTGKPLADIWRLLFRVEKDY